MPKCSKAVKQILPWELMGSVSGTGTGATESGKTLKQETN